MTFFVLHSLQADLTAAEKAAGALAAEAKTLSATQVRVMCSLCICPVHSTITPADTAQTKAASAAETQSAELARQQALAAQAQAQEGALLQQRTAAMAARTECWRAHHEATAKLAAATEAYTAAESALHASSPHSLRMGLDAIRTLVAAGKAPGVRGPLYDLIKPTHARYNVAVDAVAGKQVRVRWGSGMWWARSHVRPCPPPPRATAQLFNVVVDNEETASVVIEHLVKTKAGRVTLVPLSRIHSPPVEYPNDTDVRPLMSFLTYDAAHRAAVEQVFSKILLCRSLEVASKVRGG